MKACKYTHTILLKYTRKSGKKPVRLLTRSSTLELTESVPEISTISVVKGKPPIIWSMN